MKLIPTPTEITKVIFENIKEGAIFANGETSDNTEGCNMPNSGRKLRWVAKKGYANDWCIYIHLFHMNESWIAQHGDKVTSETNIRKLISVSDEVFKLYRY